MRLGLRREPKPRRANGARDAKPAARRRREATRAERERRIREILGRHPIETQDDLVGRLRAEGLAVTQATVSRDIKRLGLVKLPLSDGRSQYVAPERPSPADVLRRLQHAAMEYVLSVDAGEELVVVHTLTGRANAVAAAIDEMQWPDVVGTVAGDDTILIVPRRRAGRGRLLGMLRRVMEGGAP
ncbi:MAG TPA: arginine repressor [bacterium]|nr:arginine repressor [bacterium]